MALTAFDHDLTPSIYRHSDMRNLSMTSGFNVNFRLRLSSNNTLICTLRLVYSNTRFKYFVIHPGGMHKQYPQRNSTPSVIDMYSVLISIWLKLQGKFIVISKICF